MALNDRSRVQEQMITLHSQSAPQGTYASNELDDCDKLDGQNLFLDRYELTQQIADGGLGSVYRAIDTRLGRTVTIKFMKKDLNLEIQNRFKTSLSQLAGLKHQNLMCLYDCGSAPSPFMVLELVEGDSLKWIQLKNGQLPITRFVEIFNKICAALQEMHNQKCFHHNLKPDSIIISEARSEENFVKLVGYGMPMDIPRGQLQDVLKMKNANFPYMSKEQILGDEPDARSDIYSLGCVMYESLTGRLPYGCAGLTSDLLGGQLSKPRPISSFRKNFEPFGALEDIIFKALNENRAERFQTMNDLARSLTDFSKANLQGEYSAGHKPQCSTKTVITECSKNGAQVENPETTSVIFSRLELFYMSGLVTFEEAHAASNLLHRDPDATLTYFTGTCKLSQHSWEAAGKLIDLVHKELLDLEDAADMLSHCNRFDISFESAMAKFGV